ncbi:MAG TPA: winged helix-turn-helix domain-containing protein [Pyrinomonadaceae bacterium]|nr:winged helix-turn-helix domain-containing protein [Pyrinomonadaceae bacterium]
MSLDLASKNHQLNFKVLTARPHNPYEFGDFRLDAGAKLLYRNDEQISLTPKAVETLIALVERRGEVVRKDELMHEIWADTIVEESNLAQYLYLLRKTLGETVEGKPYIETLKRRGYRFNGTVRVVNSSNGAIAPTENDEEPDTLSTEQPRSANIVPRRVESRGNVRAFSQATARREAPQPVNVERTDNIYSVSDWQRPPQADTLPPVVLPARSKWLAPAALVLLAAVLTGIAFGVYKFSTSGPIADTRIVPFLGSDLTRLTTTGRSKRVAISPDGRYVAHIMAAEDGDSVWVRQVAVANDTRIAGPLLSDLVWVTFAPDGNFIYYLSLDRDKGEPELFRVPVLGGPIVKVANDIGAPTFSPDGTRIAFMIQNREESRLIVADAARAAEVMQMSREAPDHLKPNEVVLSSRFEPDYLNMFWYAPAWSPDGKNIAFPVNQSDENGRYETVMAIDVETRVERRLTDARWQQVGQPRWLADGLVVSASETSTGPNQLWHISLPDGAASRITRDVNSYQNLSLTSDAKTLAVTQRHVVSNIWTLGGNAAGAKQIMSEAGWLNELIWLPDGRLAYTSNAGGSSDIWTMNADGSGIRQLTVGANARLGLTVTVDQKQLIFAAERDGKYNLWRVNIDGSNLQRITSGDGEFYPQCTPDGRWIVYQSGGNYPTLSKMPIGGGEATPITKTTASRPSISPDGKLVAYHYLDSSFERSRWGIGITRLEDGERIKRFDFPSTVVERLVKWTPDGKAIAFLNSPGGVPNIWTQPVDGGDPKPLTDFPSDSIITFNWNTDGTSLAVIRGVETSDVLLINRAASK